MTDVKHEESSATRRPTVSVIMPVLDEERHLAAAVRQVLDQDWPGSLDVVLALGPSRDRTDAVATELAGHNRPEVLETLKERFRSMERLEAEDIADAISYVVTRPRHVAVNEVLIRPTEQAQ